jgi:DNA-binding MarR family transcriptional regulator/GNAT superfamily N-acetyltransferase
MRLMVKAAPSSARIEAVRRFSRFYTARIGALREGLLDTRFTLTESRVLWELAHRDGLSATDLSRLLELDTGYLSRLLSGFKSRRLVKALRSPLDGRVEHLTLSAAGRRAFAPLDARSRTQVDALLRALPDDHQRQLLASMETVERLLDDAASREPPFLLRPHHLGDIGWVIARHGVTYGEAYGWDIRFEALVARICADFIERFDAKREACWIAERGAANVGSIFLVQARDDDSQAVIEGVAQLRMLLVEPSARGLGLGVRLVDECTRFARAAGYRKIVLWTNSNLTTARSIYAKAGYRLMRSEPHHSFGHDLVGETWELSLHAPNNPLADR